MKTINNNIYNITGISNVLIILLFINIFQLSISALGCDVYLIAGPTGAGKSTLSKLIQKKYGGTILSLDSYIKNASEIEVAIKHPLILQWDSPNSTDWKTLVSNINEIISKGRAAIPIFSHSDHKRIGFRKILFKKPYIIEGLYALDNRLYNILKKNSLNVRKIYIDAKPEIRLTRIKKRDVEERNADPYLIDQTFKKVIRLAEIKWITKQKNSADYIIETSIQLGDLYLSASIKNKKADEFISKIFG
jgi:uridine kinase